MTMGYLHPPRHPALLGAGRPLHDVRRLPRVDPRPDAPEPADGRDRNDRSGRPPRRSDHRHQPGPESAVELHLADGRRRSSRTRACRGRSTTPRSSERPGSTPDWCSTRSGIPPSTTRPSTRLVLFTADNVMPYFKAFQNPTTALHQEAFGPTFPANFMADVRSGQLPKVSWMIPPARLRRPSVGKPRTRACGSSASAGHPHLQPEGVVQDGPVPDVRRERRLVRPRATAHRAEGHARRVADRASRSRPTPSASAGRSG